MASLSPLYDSYSDAAKTALDEYYRIYTRDDKMYGLPNFHGKAVKIIAWRQGDLSDVAHDPLFNMSGNTQPILKASAQFIYAYIQTNGFKNKDDPSSNETCCFCCTYNREQQLFEEAIDAMQRAEEKCGVKVQIFDDKDPQVTQYLLNKAKIVKIDKGRRIKAPSLYDLAYAKDGKKSEREKLISSKAPDFGSME